MKKYDLGSYLARKRISLKDFAAANNIRVHNDIGMFILANKTFTLSDQTVKELIALVDANNEQEVLPVEEVEVISPQTLPEDDEDGTPLADEEVVVSQKKPASKKRR